MANPQTEDGFVMIALDLFSAIMSSGLSGYAQIVLSEVMLRWAGPLKQRKVYLHGSELAEMTGLDRNNARRAIKELVEANVLKPSGEGFAFNKDYDSWTPKGGPLKNRLNGRLTGWIKGANERCGAPKKHKRQSNNGESIQTQTTIRDESTQTHKPGVCESTQTHGNGVYESTQTQRHIEERTRDEIREGREEELRGGEGAAPPATQEGVSLDPEYIAVGEEAIQLSGDFSWGSWVSNRGREGHPASLILQAIREADGTGNLAKPYVLKILQRCARDGITDLQGSRPGQQRPGSARAAPSRSVPTMSDDQKAEVKRKLQERRDQNAARCG